MKRSKLEDFLCSKGIVQTDDIDQAVISLIKEREVELAEKQKLIESLANEVTKYKCEEIKNQKLIKGLQEKIAQVVPCSSDTGSNFMMPSEFKQRFEEFMTSSVLYALGTVIDRPFLFSKIMSTLLSQQYKSIGYKLRSIVEGVRKVLRLGDQSFSQQSLNNIQLSLLKIFQDNWQTIFLFDDQEEWEFVISNQQISVLKQQLTQILKSEQFLQMRRQLHTIIVFMQLQEKPYQFVGLNHQIINNYNKKQYTCIDGWIKQGNPALLVLSGLRKNNQHFQNLKNFVIPLNQKDNSTFYSGIVLKKRTKQYKKFEPFQQKLLGLEEVSRLQQEKKIVTDRFQIEKCLTDKHNQDQSFIKQSIQSHPTKDLPQKQTKMKENMTNSINKKLKKKQKGRNDAQTSFKEEVSKKQKGNLNKQEEQIFFQEKIDIFKEEIICHKKNGKNKNQQDQNRQTQNKAIKKKGVEEFPVSRDLPQRKKTKTATNRKNSVGKIVQQQVLKEKENCPHFGNLKIKNKEKTYKEIIKEKLVEEKYEKETLQIAPYLRSHSERDKKQEENRPLKIQGTVGKLREKYIN